MTTEQHIIESVRHSIDKTERDRVGSLSECHLIVVSKLAVDHVAPCIVANGLQDHVEAWLAKACLKSWPKTSEGCVVSTMPMMDGYHVVYGSNIELTLTLVALEVEHESF